MACHILLLSTQLPSISFSKDMKFHFHCAASSRMNLDLDPPSIPRRSANYQPSIWHHDFIQSLKSSYMGEIYTSERGAKLKENVDRMFEEASTRSSSAGSSLHLIDTIQRLGLNYHFDDEIKSALETIMSIKDKNGSQVKDLYTRALRFRLLRQHGYQVSQDVFKSFKEEIIKSSSGDLRVSTTVKDVEGMLSLYEASFYAFEGEELMDEVQEFTSRHLNEYLKGSITSPNLSRQVRHALELPLHHTVPRIEARWFIDTYSMMENMDPLILDFAKLDFNMVQATYQEDLKYVSRWWKELGLADSLIFSRDRLVENFFFAMGFNFEPKFGYCRRHLTKVNALVTTIDDVYDVYGSLDELELFTAAVERWDVNTVDHLPNYMKICFLALYNTTNEVVYDILRQHGVNVISYLKKAWGDLCKSYLIEAKWFYSGYTPTLEEYLDNAWISISGPIVQIHIYFLLGDETAKQALNCLKNDYPEIIRYSSIICRLSDDLATSTDELVRGDVPKSIQCYMHHTGVSECTARKCIKHLINDAWKEMNKYQAHGKSNFPLSFINIGQNVARVVQCMYQYGDGYGDPNQGTKDRVMSLVVEPVVLEEEAKV